MSTYVIRKVAYYYSDEYLFVNTLGGIEKIFSSKEEAFKEFIKLEKEAFLKLDLGNIEPLSRCSGKYLKNGRELKDYFDEVFEEDMILIDEKGKVYSEYDTMLPLDLKDEEILEIRKISGIRFYELSEYKERPVYYSIKLLENNQTKLLSSDSRFKYFFNSKNEAIEYMKIHLPSILSGKEIYGDIDTLTDVPDLLKSLIQESTGIEYDKEKKAIKIKYLNNDQAISLSEILREKFFEIVEIDIDEVKDIPHWGFEIM